MRKVSFRLGAVIALTCFSALLVLGQSTGGVRGKVRTVKGDGIANATVSARKDGNEVKSSKTDSKGNFTIEGLKPGNYNFAFEAPGYSAGVLYNVEVKRNKTEELSDRLILSADQGTLVILKGSVFDRDGRSLTAAKVELLQVNADGSTKKLASANSTYSGEFTFRRPEGAAKLRVTATYKGVSGSKDVDVESAAIYRLAVSLDVARN